jgi:hypothetical protein
MPLKMQWFAAAVSALSIDTLPCFPRLFLHAAAHLSLQIMAPALGDADQLTQWSKGEYTGAQNENAVSIAAASCM